MLKYLSAIKIYLFCLMLLSKIINCQEVGNNYTKQNIHILNVLPFQTEQEYIEETAKLRNQLKNAQSQISRLVQLQSGDTYRPLPTFDLIPFEEIEKIIKPNDIEKLIKYAPVDLRDIVYTLQKDCNKKTGKIILKGPPGVGKTSLALAIVYSCKCPYILLDGTNLGDSYKNSSGTYIDELFKTLVKSEQNTALIIDELNSFTDKLFNPNNADSGAVEHFWRKLPHSLIPKSFEIEVEGQKFWVHPNATEHMMELTSPLQQLRTDILASSFNLPAKQTLLAHEMLLTDFYDDIKMAINSGNIYQTESLLFNGWEIGINPSRATGGYPVVVHAFKKIL